MWNDNPTWQPSTAWLWDPSVASFHTYRNIVGFVSGVPQHYIIDRDGNLRYARIGGIGTNKAILEVVIDELL